MKMYNVNGSVLATTATEAEMAKRVAQASSSIKTVCGIANNAAWSCALEALDHVRQHPRYRHQVKRAFSMVIAEFDAYEKRLLYSGDVRLFHLDDMLPEYRKRYGDISDREYYDYWCSTGATAYTQGRRWVTNLWNKYRLSMIHMCVSYPDVVAWGMTADAALRIAQHVYMDILASSEKNFAVPVRLLDAVFGALNVKQVADRWDTALVMMEYATSAPIDPLDEKNIQQGVDQLMEEWMNIDALADALGATTEAYDDVFRTKGEQEKALRQIAEIRN